MSHDKQHPDVAKVLGGLKDFQRISAEHVFRRLYLDTNPAKRFLIADEVGLGKTMVAKGVIAQAIEHLWSTTTRIDVLYICSNAEIARQNLRKINPIEGIDVALATRITLLPITVKELDKNKVNVISFTPGTSLDLKSSLGTKTERLLLFHLVRGAWGITGAGAENLFAGNAGIDGFRFRLATFERDESISQALAEKFIDRLNESVASEQAAGRPDLRSRLESLLPVYRSGKSTVSGARWSEGVALIGELRALLAESCLSALEPDIVVLDEFQRFKGLLDGTDPASELASHLFNYPNVRVILLSATPYKMYTVRDEAGGEDHYRDFLETLRFLYSDNVRTERVETLLRQYRRSMVDVVNGSTDRLSAARDLLEAELRSVMVRTERLGASADRNGMLVQVKSDGIALEQRDVRSYLTLQRVARHVEQPDIVEYWKSAPYVLNFMDDYKLKKAFDEASDGDGAAELARIIDGDVSSLLDWDEVRRFGRIDPANARLRSVMADTIGRGAWRILWLPPSLPYTIPTAPFDAPELSGLTKRLVFSTWRLVPKVLASVLSYEAEREMIRSREQHPENTPEARKKRSPLLRFQRSEGRLTGMAHLGMLYPSRVLARDVDPLAMRAAAGTPISTQVAIDGAKARITARIAALPVQDSDAPRADESWYWAAPILLDLTDPEVGPEARSWWESSGLAERWAGEAEDDEVEEQTGVETDTGWEAHVQEARRLVDGEFRLGPKPADLVDVVARLSLGGPGTVALRAIARGTRPADDMKPACAWSARRDGAGRVGRAIRDLFNLPEVMGLLRSADSEESYWTLVIDYSIAGNLQSVLDEYVHVLREGLGVRGENAQIAAPTMAEAISTAIGLRTSIVHVDVLRANAIRGTIRHSDETLRTRFACRLAEEKAETGSATTRQDQVRAAFNSPFWPFVLATTSVGQEGLDFHPYCHAIVHWNLPSNPVDLEQREGRVHRFKGHAVRKNLAARFASQIPGSVVGDPWDVLFDLAVAARPSGASELDPFWIFPGEAFIERHVPALPLSRDADRLESLRKALAVYRMVFGQPRQDELLAYLSSRLSPDELEIARLAGQIRLAPVR
ncbi:MAG: hypothetical protein EXS13_11720 [Planctomycetes bacterium]|nr:hypothetical protein [Planctomycetota bacterium]